MRGARGGRAGVLLAAALWAGSCGGRGAVPPSELSVVLVTLDTTRADRIGAYGARVVPTPHLDRVAREGVLFEEAIAQAPLTLPSHATLFTGRYPPFHGVRHNGTYQLPASETTLAERLRQAGFETAGFVGAFVLNRGFGVEQGFDVYDEVPVSRYRGGRDQIFEAERTADDVNRRVFAWLDRRGAGRFFLWVHYYDPHDPYQPPETPARSLAGDGYDREISYVDACFGDLLKRLRKEGLLDRSLLVVAGDHGESLGEHGEKTHGLFLYESALRVPLLLRAPGLLPAGGRVRGPVELADVAPTVLDLLGLPPLENAQGRSLRARISGEEDATDAVVRTETLLPWLDFGWSELRAVREGPFKYIEAPVPELYDLRQDPREEVNLATVEPERVARLAAMLAGWKEGAEGTAPTEASRGLTAEEEAMLRSLGYLGGDGRNRAPGEGERLDPKQGVKLVAQIGKAKMRIAEGDPAAAIRLLEEVLRADPRNPAALNMRAAALVDLGRLEEAEAQALEALAVSQDGGGAGRMAGKQARQILAKCAWRRGRLAEAESFYRRLVEEQPWDVVTAVELARVVREAGRGAEARKLVEERLAREPRDGYALALRLELQLDAGDREGALESARALADVRDGYSPALARAAELLMESGDPKRAVACLEVAIEQTRRPDAGLVRGLAEAQLAAGDLEAARKSFRALVSLLPGRPWPRYQLARIAAREGKVEEARAHLLDAIRLDPSFEPARRALREIEAMRLGAAGRTS